MADARLARQTGYGSYGPAVGPGPKPYRTEALGRREAPDVVDLGGHRTSGAGTREIPISTAISRTPAPSAGAAERRRQSPGSAHPEHAHHVARAKPRHATTKPSRGAHPSLLSANAQTSHARFAQTGRGEQLRIMGARTRTE